MEDNPASDPQVQAVATALREACLKEFGTCWSYPVAWEFARVAIKAKTRRAGGGLMSYDYATERPGLFTEEGQVQFLKVRDQVKRLLAEAGAVRAQEAWKGMAGDSWQFMACIDRLVELHELVEVTNSERVWGQNRVFVAGRG